LFRTLVGVITNTDPGGSVLTIEYRVIYSGDRHGPFIGAVEEQVRVQARDINAGFRKALRRALEPLGNGNRREIARIEFWQVVS